MRVLKKWGLMLGLMMGILLGSQLFQVGSASAQDVYSCSDDQYDYYVMSDSITSFSSGRNGYSLRGNVKLVQDGQLVTTRLYSFDIGGGVIKSTTNGVRFYVVSPYSVEASICNTMMEYR